jgi:hypothetical protein
MAMATAQTPPGKNYFKHLFLFSLMTYVPLKKNDLDFYDDNSPRLLLYSKSEMKIL